jgi:uncharacterized protein (TIGR03663 family)
VLGGRDQVEERVVTTIVDERAPVPPLEPRLERLLAWRPPVTAETLAYAVILLAAFALRFWDLGARAMHHDESLHATYSWYLYDGRGYEHHPLMHGPLLFHLMALVYLLFGVSDATARFVPAAFGTAMVLLPLLLRPWLGRLGALAAAALLAFSPTLLYFSRFVGAGAQDILVAVGMLLIVAGIWRYRATGADRWLYLVAGGLALGFTTKEVTYMLAAVLVLYLNGALAAELAARPSSEPARGAARRWLTLGLMPVAWVVALVWPWFPGLRRRFGGEELPRSGALLIVVGTLAAPFFAAGVEVPLGRVGVRMAAPAPIDGWTNEQFWGALTIGVLVALSAYVGLGWDRRRWLVCAAIFWGLSIPLFTTFFTNPEGVATGIWGSLDYWLQQQDVRRGTQPVFYYLVLTPVYEYLTLGLALVGVISRALRSGWDTAAAALAAVVLLLVGAVVGDGAHLSLVFVVPALLAVTYALRADPFRQFLVFWLGAMLLGLSAAGEKMPWLAVHLALPLALLAALTLAEAAGAVHGLTPKAWVRPVLTGAAVGWCAMAWALLSDRLSWANAALVVTLLVSAAALVVAALGRRVWAVPAAAALWLGLFGPLSVRTAVVAAFAHGDIPVEMLVYTQTTPELHAIQRRIEEYARRSGLGTNLPITVDSTEAFTWPWAWYLRDYRNVSYPDLTAYRANPSLVQSLPAGGVLLAEYANADVGVMRPDLYGPGIPYKHRWWFPEEYRSTTTANLFRWLRDPAYWKLWGNYFLHRIPPAPLGSIDAVAYFPVEAGANPVQAMPPQPRTEANGRLVAGGSGIGAGFLRRPAGLTVDRDGNVYVADSLNHRVQKYGPDGRYLATLGGPQQFREPWGVAVDRDGTIYVADTWNHRIQKFDRAFRLLAIWGSPVRQVGLPNPDSLELYGPRAIAIDGEGNLWVTDTGNNRVLKFSPDGQPLGSFGGPGNGPGQFQEPVGIAIAPNGDILVTDTWNGRVQRFDAAFGYKGEFRVEGWEDRGAENKPYLAVGSDGSVYVTVPNAGAVLVYAPDGRPLGALRVADASPGGGTRPLGVAAGPGGVLWVSDGAAGTITRLLVRHP